MSPDIILPLEVMGLGIIISYGIAGLMQLTLICIRAVRRNADRKGAVK